MSERSHIPQPGDVLGGKYEIEGRLGQGGMGLVLAARNVRTNRRVAIKWLLPRLMDNVSALKRFEREAQVAGQINHPNVVNVYDIERDGDTLYIVMELLEGESLAERLAGGRPLSLAETAPVFMGVLRGVAAAHAAGVVHRDLKPDNVFLCRPRDGSAEIPKVLDFGISKLSKRENVSTITEEGSLLGTVQYMSPEQLRGQDTDERTDVYALGVILFRMLSAQMPFQGANHIDLVLNMASHPARSLGHFLPGVPEGLERAVAFALERDAGQRFASVEQFARALEPYFAGHAFRITSGSLRAVQPAPAAEPRPAPVQEVLEETPFAADDQRQEERAERTPLRLPSFTTVIGLLGAAAGIWQYYHHIIEPQLNRTPATSVAPAAEPDSTRHSAQPAPKPRAERRTRPPAASPPVPPAPARAEPSAFEPVAATADAGPPPHRSQRTTPTRAERSVRANRAAAPPVPEPQPESEAQPPAAPKERYRAGKPDRNEF